MALLGLFGAGSGGAIIVQWLLRRRGSSEENAKRQDDVVTIRTSATGDGMAATHTGSGSISMTKNALVSHDMLESWRIRLGLSLTAVSRLFDACARAELPPERIDRLGRTFDNSNGSLSAPTWMALRDALEANNIERAAELLRSLSDADTPKGGAVGAPRRAG